MKRLKAFPHPNTHLFSSLTLLLRVRERLLEKSLIIKYLYFSSLLSKCSLWEEKVLRNYLE